MKLLASKNIFESIRFFYNLNKLSGYLFFTFSKDGSGQFSSKTTAIDYFSFAASTTFSIYGIYSFVGGSLIANQDAIIIFIGLFILSRLMIIQPLFFILSNFHNRKKMFKILYNFHWIDEQVSLGSHCDSN